MAGINDEACSYDGGDCCSCDCVDSASYTCGIGGYDCVDPSSTCYGGEPNCCMRHQRRVSCVILQYVASVKRSADVSLCELVHSSALKQILRITQEVALSRRYPGQTITNRGWRLPIGNAPHPSLWLLQAALDSCKMPQRHAKSSSLSL